MIQLISMIQLLSNFIFKVITKIVAERLLGSIALHLYLTNLGLLKLDRFKIVLY